jgi:hypothetical protein
VKKKLYTVIVLCHVSADPETWTVAADGVADAGYAAMRARHDGLYPDGSDTIKQAGWVCDLDKNEHECGQIVAVFAGNVENLW